MCCRPSGRGRCGLSFSFRNGSLKKSRPTHLCAALRLESASSQSDRGRFEGCWEAGISKQQQAAWEQTRDIDGKHVSSATIRLESARRQGSLVFGKNRLMAGLHHVIMSEEAFRVQLVGHLGRDLEGNAVYCSNCSNESLLNFVSDCIYSPLSPC